MNILFISHYSGLYGSIRSLLDLVSGLQAFGIKPFFVVPRDGLLTGWLSSSGIPYKTIPLPWWISKHSLSFRQRMKTYQEITRSVGAIRNLMGEWNINLVYSNSSVIPSGRIACMGNHVPHIWHIREFGDLDFSLKYILPKWLSKKLILSSNAVICHAKVIRDYHFKPVTKRVHQVYNGVATRVQFDQLLVRRKDEIPHKVFTFLIASAITHKKGQEDAIRAVAELYKRSLPVKLVLAGHGKDFFVDHLWGLVRELGIEKAVELTGFVEDAYPYYFSSDCVLVCSEHEALSRVALEAMSTALPVIGKNSGGNPEIILDGQTGFLYDTFEGLVQSMTSFVQEPEKARQCGLAGWKRAREMFNIEDYAAGVYEVIQGVMKKKQ